MQPLPRTGGLKPATSDISTAKAFCISKTGVSLIHHVAPTSFLILLCSQRYHHPWRRKHCGFELLKFLMLYPILNTHISKDSVSVENALYSDPRVLEAAAVGVPDEHLGELVATLVTLRPEYAGQVTESMLLEQCRGRYVASRPRSP